MKNPRTLLLPAALVLLAVSSAQAQIVEFIIVSKDQYFTQLTNTTVSAGTNFRFEASVEGTDLSSISAPTLDSKPGGTGPLGPLVQDPDDSSRWILQQNYGSGAALESAYNAGNFGMTVLGQSLTVGLPNETPRFPVAPTATLSGGTIVGGVLTWDVSQSLTISLADPLSNVSNPANFAAVDHTSLSIWGQDLDRGAEAFGNGTLSITIGGSGANNTFIAGQTYWVEMDFINIVGGTLPATISGGALDGASYGGVYGRTVNFQIQAIPEPSTYAALAGVGALGLACWRRRRMA